jgi:probable HAF family extracellular repeat protein
MILKIAALSIAVVSQISICLTQDGTHKVVPNVIRSASGSSFEGLGYLSGSNSGSKAKSVSYDGSVVIGNCTIDSMEQAFLWTQQTGMTSLGNLPDSSLKQSWANKISGDGTVIVGYGDQGSGRDSYKGFKWTRAGGMVLVGALKGSSKSTAWDVSANGSVIVGDGGEQTFRWTEADGMVGLGALPDKTKSRAVAVSEDGSVLVGSCYTVDWKLEEAFIWTQKSGIVGLGCLPKKKISFALDVSPDGSVVVGTAASSSGYPAFRWTKSTGMIDIGHLPGKKTTHPGGLSSNGSIIVGASYSDPTHSDAFIWDADHGMRVLQTVLQSDYGLDLTGWTLQNAADISPDGKVIVGWGINPSGHQEAFRVVLDTLSARSRGEKEPGSNED